VVSWDEDLVGNRQGGKPVDERAEFRLVAVGVLPVRGVTGVDHHVDTGRYREQVVVHVCV